MNSQPMTDRFLIKIGNTLRPRTLVKLCKGPQGLKKYHSGVCVQGLQALNNFTHSALRVSPSKRGRL